MADQRTRLRRWSLAAIVVNVGIVVTGGVVRVTGSGLGCPDWPTCEGTRLVPTAAADSGWHQAIEFGNRLLTFVVLATVVGVYVLARREADQRARRLALALPLGVLAQAVLGGITVLTGLHPLIVAAHFLLSMVLIAIAVLLHGRTVARPAPAPSPVRRLARWTLAAGALVLVLGTLVTAAGPHAGDPDTHRLALDIRTVARLHAGTVWVTVGLTVATLVLARRHGAAAVASAAGWLLAVEIAQGAVGYTQYALGIPAALVSVHLLLAGLFWVAAVRTFDVAGGIGTDPAVEADPVGAVA